MFHGLPNVQDEPYAAEYRPTVVFNGLSNVQDETYPPLDHQNTGPLSCSVPLMLVHVSDLSGSSLLPLLHMLVHFLSNVNSVFEHAYVSHANWHPSRAAIIVRIETMHFFQRSQDFAAFQRRKGEILLRIP